VILQKIRPARSSPTTVPDVGQIKYEDHPTLSEAWKVIAMTKRVNDPPSGLLQECGPGGGKCERGNRLAKGPQWGLRLYRGENDGMLRASLFANGQPLIGLDFHRASKLDAHGDLMPPGYHWDLYPPLAEQKCALRIDCDRVLTAIESRDPALVDPVALDIIRYFWHVRFEREDPRLPLRQRRRRTR
jgi:hypothetical protein